MPEIIAGRGPDAAVAEVGAQLPPSLLFPAAGSAAGSGSEVWETLDFVEDAVRRIVTLDRSDAALRELEAFLLEVLCWVGRDPGLELAAQDLHSAARIIVEAAHCGCAPTDRRRLRLLADAARRFRAGMERVKERRHS
jgi:hypothetical protein